MSNVLQFELSEFRKWNERKTETKGVWSVASCPALDREVRTVRGSPNGKLARKLLAEFDLDPNTPVEVCLSFVRPPPVDRIARCLDPAITPAS